MSAAKKKVSKRKATKPKVLRLGPGQRPPKTIRLGPDGDRVRSAAAAVAEEIISPAPPWLPDFLSELSFELASAHSIGEIWPTREELEEKLAEIDTLASLLEQHLEDSAVTGFIEINSEAGSFKVLSDTAQNLKQLRSRIRQALKSPELVDENGKLLRGRGKPLLPNTMPPRYVCVAIITEVIDFFYPDRALRPSKRKARSAADKLWRTWFEPDPEVSAELTRWKESFKRADDPRLQPLRSYILRVLSSKDALRRFAGKELAPNLPI